mmetsp:Transcript_16529/g.19072  ORF Transcript_16529/g.19072 Transcript_16529/m.19072 type:complete len:227 (+) Transcript_16529:1823-2503(+)
MIRAHSSSKYFAPFSSLPFVVGIVDHHDSGIRQRRLLFRSVSEIHVKPHRGQQSGRDLEFFRPVRKGPVVISSNTAIIFVGQMQDGQGSKGVYGNNLLHVAMFATVEHSGTHPNALCSLGGLVGVFLFPGPVAGHVEVTVFADLPLLQEIPRGQEHSLMGVVHLKVRVFQFRRLEEPNRSGLPDHRLEPVLPVHPRDVLRRMPCFVVHDRVDGKVVFVPDDPDVEI